MTTSFQLLRDTTQKLLELHHIAEWQPELLKRCPPILWFGDTTTTKPKVVTLGANPSRQEYIAHSSQKASDKLKATGDETEICYLESPKNRFRLLNTSEKLENIITNTRIQTEIIQAYDSYFMNNPYKWFGKPKPDSYNVEGFLHGIDASYFSTTRYQAIHIDLFPFATIRDFNALHYIANRDLFSNNWAQSIVQQLLTMISPEILLIFGRSNVWHYTTHINPLFKDITWNKYENARYCVKKDDLRNLTVVGLSTNLGNPKGFTANSLKSFGNHIKQELGVNI